MSTKKQRDARKAKYSSARRVSEKQDQGFGPQTIKLPPGWELLKLKDGINKFDVLPCPAGAHNRHADEGTLHYEHTYFIHKNVGPADKSVTCLKETFGEACPICEDAAKRQKAGTLDEETRKSLRPKERQIFAVRDREDGLKKKILENSHYKGVGELLKDKLLSVEEDHAYNDFHHLDKGMYLSVKCKKTSLGGGGSFNEPANIELVPRKPIPESILDEVPCLEDLIVRLKYKDIKEMYLAGAEKGDEEEVEETEEEAPAPKKKGKKPAPKPADDEEEEEEEEAEVEDEDEEETEEEEEEEEEEPAPKKKGKKPPVEEEDEEIEEEEEESDDDEGETVEVGSRVAFTSKGKTVTGKIAKLDPKKGTADVKLDNGNTAKGVSIDTLEAVTDEEEEEEEEEIEEIEEEDEDAFSGDDDEEEEEEEEEEEPAPKKKPAGKKK